MPRKTPPSPEENIASAIALAKAILASDAHETHKREFLSFCVYKASEATHKFDVSYWSYGVWARVQPYSTFKAVLRLSPRPIHEHVHTRKSLVDAMLKDSTCIERVLREEAFACLVTKEEDRLLKNTLVGFDRYTAAGIRVWDVKNQRWIYDAVHIKGES
jgi:hypothetical protein